MHDKSPVRVWKIKSETIFSFIKKMGVYEMVWNGREYETHVKLLGMFFNRYY